MVVDVVSIGSESRFDYMTTQLQTWAATSRNFYGFTESTDFDPSCSLSLSDESVRLDYLNTCRLPNVGTKRYGIGHGKSGGWICAQRRVGKALGWLQAVYSSSRKGGVKVKRGIPDILVIVDDDTSVDLNKVKQLMMKENSSSIEEPYIAAGSVFQLGKYGGFKAPHGGFGTYLNKAAIELMTRRPIFCNKDDGLIPTIGEDEDPFTINACTQLAQNKAQELDVYSPGDSVFNIFYKLSSRPYFCMHSDWMIGFMITNYGMTRDGLVQVDPQGKRGYCGEESVSCHYQTPTLMEQFVQIHPQQAVPQLLPLSSSALSGTEVLAVETAPKLDATLEEETISYNPLHICDLPTNHVRMQHPNVNQPCPSILKDRPLLLLKGTIARGRTGNNLMELLHAIQLTKDQDIQLGMMKQSWAMKLVTKLWFETNENTNTFDYNILEKTLCIRIFDSTEEVEGWNVVYMTTQELFVYHSPLSVTDYMTSQLDIFRRLFQSILYAGQGINLGSSLSTSSTIDMCSVVNELFPTLEERSSAIYTVIHSRHRGYKKVSKKTGCDLTAALEMQPEFIKSTLQPLGMLEYPIVLITDGEDSAVLERLASDPDIGRQLRVLDKSSSTLGGEMTLAMMSQVFIGNPGSSLSAFIAKARVSFGFEHNKMYMAKDLNTGQWQSVCGDQCLFDYDIMGDQA